MWSNSLGRINRINCTTLILAPLMPLAAGVIFGAFTEPFPTSDLELALGWIAQTVAMAAPLGFAIWLAWRFQPTREGWKRLAAYSLLFVPPSLLHSTLLNRVSLFVQTTSIDALNPGMSALPGSTVADEIYPDCLRFGSLLFTLAVIRCLTGIALVREGEPARMMRISIRSMLALTLVAAVMFLVATLEVRSNATILTRFTPR